MQWQCNFCVTKTRHVFVQIFLGLMLSIFFGLGFGFFVMMLWNNLLPDIWGWKEISYWQGTGLVILTRLLLGSYGYHKALNQPQAGCHEHFLPQKADCAAKNDDTCYEQWWEEEGEASFEKYTRKILTEEAPQQDK